MDAKLNLLNISIDCQLLIIEKLDFCNLLELSQVNNHFSSIASDIFYRRYGSKLCSISYGYGKTEDNSVEVTESQFTIKNHKMAISYIEKFGYLIENIQIDYTFIGYDEQNELQNVINKHCAFLNSMELIGCNEYVFRTFQQPLSSVTSLTITRKLTAYKSPLKLNETFPNLQSLYLDDVRISHTDPRVLDIKFTKLKHVSTTSLRGPFLNLAIIYLMNQNSQIRSFTTIDCFSFEYLRVINKHLPNLEVLNIVWDKVQNDFIGEKIHFSHVKSLSMRKLSFDVSEIMSFEQLKQLDIQCLNHNCVNFVVKNRNLTKLSIDQTDLDDEKMMETIDALTNLEELSIKSSLQLQPETIINLVNLCCNRQLKVLHLDQSVEEEVFQKIQFSLEDTMQQFDGEWNVSQNQSGIFIQKFLISH